MKHGKSSICIVYWKHLVGLIALSILDQYTLSSTIALDMNICSKESIVKSLENSDIIITEAYNNKYIHDGEGYRLAKYMANCDKKPLVLFRSLKTSFRKSPHLIDYYSIHLLPSKVEYLLALKKPIMDNFSEIENAYPYLKESPRHP